jgi:hypothetical protein
MAHTVTVYEDAIEGINSAVYADLAFSGTYATGGETLVPAAFGLNNIESVSADVTNLSATAINAVFDRATGKLVLVAPAGTQVANATSLTGVTASVRVLGN